MDTTNAPASPTDLTALRGAPATSSKFRLNGYGFFLTYPQCPLTKERVAELLTALSPIVKGVIAAEKHVDGSPHIHAYVKFAKKLNVTK